MLSPSPAVRAVLIGLVIVTLVVFGATTLHLQSLGEEAEVSLVEEVGGQTAMLAAALASGENVQTIRRAFTPLADTDASSVLALVDARGRVVDASDLDLMRGFRWTLVIEEGATSSRIFRGREPYLVAIRPIGQSGHYVASAIPAREAAPTAEAVWNAAVWAAVIWGILMGCLMVMGWYAGPHTSSRLQSLGARIAQGEADPDVLIRHARLGLGQMATVFAPIAAKMTSSWASVAQSREHVRALYQVNPHYVILCSLDGRIIEANPAFYAVTGLSLEAFKAGPVEILDDIFPIGPLQEMARRSLREACSIGGIEYGIIGQDDEPRAVTVSLRAFTLDGEDVVIIQATDVSARRTMEQRIHAFNDTLDLMVDRRVAQLTAGQKSIRRVLDGAGLALASFDASGATRRWSGGARGLTGCTVGQVPHFSSVTGALGLEEAERSAFTAWFWGNESTPFVARHAVADAEGDLRIRRFVWRKSTAVDRGDLRTIVGLELPRDPSDPAPKTRKKARTPVADAALVVPEPGSASTTAKDATSAPTPQETEPASAESSGDGFAGSALLPDSAFARTPSE